jgi:hypothetical protein
MVMYYNGLELKAVLLLCELHRAIGTHDVNTLHEVSHHVKLDTSVLD